MRFVAGADFEDRSLTMIAEVPQGGLAWFMEGDAGRCSPRPRRPARERWRRSTTARRSRCSRSTAPLAGVSSATTESRDEADALTRHAAGGAVAGFYCYGEIARTVGVSGIPQPDARGPGTRADPPDAVPGLNGGENWSTQQLAEFLAVVSSVPEPAAAVREAIERAAEALEAEVGAVVSDGVVSRRWASPPAACPRPPGRAGRVARRRAELPGLGPCRIAVAPLEGEGRRIDARWPAWATTRSTGPRSA